MTIYLSVEILLLHRGCETRCIKDSNLDSTYSSRNLLYGCCGSDGGWGGSPELGWLGGSRSAAFWALLDARRRSMSGSWVDWWRNLHKGEEGLMMSSERLCNFCGVGFYDFFFIFSNFFNFSDLTPLVEIEY